MNTVLHMVGVLAAVVTLTNATRGSKSFPHTNNIHTSFKFHPPDITAFTQTPSGIVAPDSVVTFNCKAIGSHVSWYINGSRTNARDTRISDVPIGGDSSYRNLTLTIVADADSNNNTHILCFATGSQSGQEDIMSLHLIIASEKDINNTP